MAYPKHFHFRPKRQDLARFGFVLAHPARLKIIELLANKQALQKCDFIEEISLSPNAISDHLRHLERAQLIKLGKGPGGQTGYVLNKDRYQAYLCDLNAWLSEVAIKPAA